MAVCRLVVLRHGETAWNVEERLQGFRDSALTARGRRQVELLAERLGSSPFAALYTSDLPRAVASIAPLAERVGLEPTLDPRLRERNLGVFEGLTAEQCRERHAKDWERFKSNDPEYVIPGGESGVALSERVRDALGEIARRHLGQSVALMGHGGTLRHVFLACLSLPLSAVRKFSAENASVNVVDYDEHAGFYLHSWGDVAHLAAMPEDGAEVVP